MKVSSHIESKDDFDKRKWEKSHEILIRTKIWWKIAFIEIAVQKKNENVEEEN